jgi:hypothetical protein
VTVERQTGNRVRAVGRIVDTGTLWPMSFSSILGGQALHPNHGVLRMSHKMLLRTSGNLHKLIQEPILALRVVFTIRLLTTRPSNDERI